MRIFVSHSSQDKPLCTTLVNALRGAGADVWYDDQNLGAGHLFDTIGRELRAREIFIVVLSKAALDSPWVAHEYQIAQTLCMKDPTRVILPITAQQMSNTEFHDGWLFLAPLKRIEGPGGAPLPIASAVAEVLHTLGLSAKAHLSASKLAQRQSGKRVLWVDDVPSNNFYARRSLERLGINVTISTGTDDALGKLVQHQYAAIISDMRRPPDDRAGYTLLEWTRRIHVHVPFILYTFSYLPHHVAEARQRGAYDQTSDPDELIRLVLQALSKD